VKSHLSTVDLLRLPGAPYVFDVITSSSDSGALKNECLGLIDDPDVETGCASVQITECAVRLLHSRPIQLPDECQTGSTPFRGSKDDRNVRRVLELRPRVCLQLGRDESCFREPRLRRCSRQFPRYVNLGTSRGEAYKLLNAT
jgi:hypothetical protein